MNKECIFHFYKMESNQEQQHEEVAEEDQVTEAEIR